MGERVTFSEMAGAVLQCSEVQSVVEPTKVSVLGLAPSSSSLCFLRTWIRGTLAMIQWAPTGPWPAR